jgi:pimeloyl-ACP methyl ester carboxylesterase
MTRLLLVHGAFHGAWCWDKLRPELGRRGIENDVIELPFTTPEGDAAAVRKVVDRLSQNGDPVTLLGHSLGGAVISAAGAEDGTPYPGINGLIYLAALMIAPDQTVDFSGAPGMTAVKATDEVASFDLSRARSAFYHQCTEEDAAWATARLRTMPTAVLLTGAPSEPAWRFLPSHYLMCSDDQMVSVDAQRSMAANARSTLTMDSDHSPFLSHPTELASLLEQVLQP